MTTDAGTGGAPPVTLADVARAAGVSIATASKALNGRAQVRDSTRRRVEEAAAALSFTPNPFARALNAARTGTVGVVTSELDHRFVVPIVRGAGGILAATPRSMLLADTRDEPAQEDVRVREMLARRVDGLLIVGRTTNPRPPAPVMAGVPVVYVYAPSTGEQDVSFTPDNVMAGRLAAEHLIAQGRTRIALVNGESSYSAARDRAEGVMAALADHGLEPVGGSALYGQWGEAWGRDCARLLVRGGDPVDGIIGGSDHIARGVLDTLRDEGRDVPGDVAVIGFDDWDLLVREARPPLSSVAMELEHLGRVAAQRLVDMIDSERTAGVSREPVRVVARASTGA